ncbi:MAG: hypothetical protein GF331_20655, partial [Chitinivibrionales bacterium]|nr:hypothetical protein [Chitinivibrionales bacterium]
DADHYLFVLVDGLGDRLVDELPREAFLSAHRCATLRAVFPSTTAAALTTLATARWPGEHCVLGWWMYLPGADVNLVTLPFTERTTGMALERYGVRAADVYPVPSVWHNLARDACVVLPQSIVASVYSRYARGEAEHLAYTDLGDAVRTAAARVRGASGSSLTYLYLPQLDTVMHEQGPYAEDSRKTLRAIDRALVELADAVRGRARVVVTADHGHVAIPPESRRLLPPGDPLYELLVTRPSGEPRVPFFHVRQGSHREFEQRFEGRFGDDYLLVAADAVDRMRLFGPNPMHPTARARLGSHVGFPRGANVFVTDPDAANAGHAGAHGGPLRDEMRIPLVLA